MKAVYIYIIMVLGVLNACAQTDSFEILRDTGPDLHKDSLAAKPVGPLVYTFVEQMPEFEGGTDGLIKFVQKELKYPEMERDNDIQGKVIVRFVVDENGKVGEVMVLRSVSPGLDKEAVRVVKLMPPFKPGMQQGKAVKVYYNLPVVFKLADDKKPEDIDSKCKKDWNFKSGLGLMQEGKFDKAYKLFKRSVAEYPRDYLGYDYLAQCEAKLGKPDESCRDYRKAKALGSTEADKYLREHCAGQNVTY